MKVSGFTIIRNAVKFDYPVTEAIHSILPLCDELIVAVGDSEDDTLCLIKKIDSPKIKILLTTWDDSLRTAGKVLAVETDKALQAVSPDADWLFYIQADECVHERWLPVIREEMEKTGNNPAIEGLLFKYLHFYGSYDYVAASRQWYRHEIRLLKNLPGIHSYRDAQGFRINGKKLKVKEIDACIYHYGWVRHPKTMQQKRMSFNKMYGSDEWIAGHIPQATTEEFDYTGIDYVKRFEGTHPAVFQPRVNAMNWKFEKDPAENTMPWKYRVMHFIERITGKRFFEYRNYKKIE